VLDFRLEVKRGLLGCCSAGWEGETRRSKRSRSRILPSVGLGDMMTSLRLYSLLVWLLRNIPALSTSLTVMGDQRNARKRKTQLNAVAGPPPPSPPPRPKPKPRKRQPEAEAPSVVITRPPRPKSKPAGVDSQSIIEEILSARSEKIASVSVADPEIGSGEEFKFDGLSGSDDEDEEEIDDEDEPASPRKASKKSQSRAAGNGTYIPFHSFPRVSYSVHS
jgi:hypothetical protein